MRTARRRTIVYIAVSADGFIARKDGSVDGVVRLHYHVAK